MPHGISGRRSLLACAAAAARFGAAPAAAGAATSGSGVAAALAAVVSTATSSCTAPALTSPFAALGDTNSYALVPGESADQFAGTGWTLLGGAKIVTATLQDGKTGSVLQVPSGGLAISPSMCVTNAYPTARAIVRDVGGSAGVSMYVAYLSTDPSLVATASLTDSAAWQLSPVVDINPSSATGWQLAWFSFLGNPNAGTTELYDLYIDPRMKS